MKTCIFTTYNYQIDEEVIKSHHKVINKLIQGTDIEFVPLRYNLSRRYIKQWAALDYGMRHLIKEYDNFLILDVDCIPLSQESLLYTIDKIKQNILVGCGGNFCVGFSKELFEKLGNISFENFKTQDEIFIPSKYELELPEKDYNIGTTFINSNGDEMFYHLYECIEKTYDDKFISKCEQLTETTKIEEPVMFNPFGSFLLNHKIPNFIFNSLKNKVDEIRPLLKDDNFIKENNFADYLAGKNTYQIKMPKNSEFENYILNLANHYIQTVGAPYDKIKMGSVWINYTYKGDFNPIHTHDSLLSGVIYVHQDDGIMVEMNNNTNFRSASSIPGMTHFAYDLNSHPFNKFSYSNKFIEGSLTMFPSWLSHWVNPFTTDGERVTIAFNVLGDN